MTVSMWMILVAAFLPYVTVALAKFGGAGYDNADPRGWAGRVDGWRARALAAHQNHFESFAPFAAAVLTARVAGSPHRTADLLAVLFIVFRVAYTISYLRNAPTFRSALWACGFACVVALFAVSA